MARVSDQEPTFIAAIFAAGDQSWMADARCRHGSLPAEAWKAATARQQPTRREREDVERQRRLAGAVCEQCPVQWRCCEWAVDSLDLWNVCAVGPAERESLSKAGNWRELLAMARVAGMSVAELVSNVEASRQA